MTTPKHCPACGVDMKQEASRKRQKVAAPTKPPAMRRMKKPAPKIIKNHFVLVADISGSMQAHAQGAKQMFNEQLQMMRDRQDQQNRVTLFYFDDQVREQRYNDDPKSVPNFNSWPNGGQTALWDAICAAAGRAECDSDPDVSFCAIIITDGEENHSRNRTETDVREKIEKLQGTGRWTFVFLVPPGSKSRVANLGVPSQNIREWDRIDAQLQSEMKTSGMAYYTSRASGQRSVKNWFAPDLSKVSVATLNDLTDVTDEVKVWTVDKEEDIRSFVDRRSRGKFAPGCSFYQLQKREDTVQPYKRLMLRDKASGAMYADGPTRTVRNVCGLPATGDVSIEPGNHANFDVFVQSNSTNRKLPRGTKVAFRA